MSKTTEEDELLEAGIDALQARYANYSNFAWHNDSSAPARVILLAYDLGHINPRKLKLPELRNGLYTTKAAVKAVLAAAKEYEETMQAEPDWIGAKEAAEILGRSYGYVKDHGHDLKGVKDEKGAWRFDRKMIETFDEWAKQ